MLSAFSTLIENIFLLSPIRTLCFCAVQTDAVCFEMDPGKLWFSQCTFSNVTGNSQTEIDHRNNGLVLLVFPSPWRKFSMSEVWDPGKKMLEPSLRESSCERLQLQHTQSRMSGLHNIGKRWVPSKWKNTLDFLLINTCIVPHLGKLHRLRAKDWDNLC